MSTTKLFSTSFSKRLAEIATDAKDPVAIALQQEEFIKQPNIHHITFRDGDDVVSFCPKGKEQAISEDGEWKREGRQTMKIGKTVRALFTDSANAMFNDRAIEVFVNRFKASYEDVPFIFKEVKGKQIAHYYHEDQYDYNDAGDTSGSLWDSCMRYNTCQDYLDLYVKNEDRVSMVCMLNKKSVRGNPHCTTKKESLLVARALLWKLDDGRMFMDRIYSLSEKHDEQMQKYARSKGYWFRNKNSRTHKDEIRDANNQLQTNQLMKVSGIEVEFNRYPYCDTLTYLCLPESNGIGFLCNQVQNGTRRALENTGGGFETMNVVLCSYDGVLRDVEDCVHTTHGEYIGWAAHSDVVGLSPNVYGRAKSALRKYADGDNYTGYGYLLTDLEKDAWERYVYKLDLRPLSFEACRRFGFKIGAMTSHRNASFFFHDGIMYDNSETVVAESIIGRQKTLKTKCIFFKSSWYVKNAIPPDIERLMKAEQEQKEKAAKAAESSQAVESYDLFEDAHDAFRKMIEKNKSEFPITDDGAEIFR